MRNSRRDDAPPEILAADPSGVPAEPDPAPEKNGNGAPRQGRKGKPHGTRGLRLPRRFKKASPGAAAGIEPHELVPGPGPAPSERITCIDYSPERVEPQEVSDLPAFIAVHRPEWSVVR